MTKTKTAITAEQVRRLGELAKISMTEAEEERLRKELASILDYFRVIDGVPESARVDHQSDQPANLRRDEAGPSDPEGVLKGVPQRKGRFVKAPRVF